MTATRTPLPVLQISLILLVQLCEPIAYTSVFPFINSLVVEVGIAKEEKDVGYYVGLIESLFFLTEATFVLHWSRLSDRIGAQAIRMLKL